MLAILNFPSEKLKTVCAPIEAFGTELNTVLDQMPALMLAAKGRGLAANQVGITLRFFVMKDSKGNILEFINPEIIEQQDIIQSTEGCLSFPGISVQIPRFNQVTVKALDRNGVEFTVVCEELEAVCVQHEIEHLNGITFIDKLPRQQRRAILKRLGIN